MFAAADTLFERLVEYLQEYIARDIELELWLDRSVHFNASNAPTSTPENFPCVITSRSINNFGGGMLLNMQTKLQVKIDVVEREIEMLTRGEVDELALLEKRLAVGRKMNKCLDD